MNKFIINAQLEYDGGVKNVGLVEAEYEPGNSNSVVGAIRNCIDKVEEIEKTIHDQPDILREFVPEFRKFTISAIRADGTVIDEIDIAAGEEYQIGMKAMRFLTTIFTYA